MKHVRHSYLGNDTHGKSVVVMKHVCHSYLGNDIHGKSVEQTIDD